MKKSSKILFFLILFLSFTIRFEQGVADRTSNAIEQLERFERSLGSINSIDQEESVDLINLINSLDSVNSGRLEQGVADRTSNAIERIEQFERFHPVDSINSINLFNQAYAQETQQQPTSSGIKLPTSYVIGQGDVLEVFVWRNEKLSRVVVVRPDGKISLPLIHDVQAEGLTVLWLKNEVTRRFGEYLEHPRVTVIVNQITSYKVSVLGQVVRPGVYPITGDTTLVEAISMAGGFTEWANKRKITVIRDQGGKKRKITINYKKIVSGKDPSQNIVLKRHDTIIVP